MGLINYWSGASAPLITNSVAASSPAAHSAVDPERARGAGVSLRRTTQLETDDDGGGRSLQHNDAADKNRQLRQQIYQQVRAGGGLIDLVINCLFFYPFPLKRYGSMVGTVPIESVPRFNK